MANYANLKDIINNPTQHGLPAWNNDANQIEGVTMKGYLLAVIDSLTVGYQFMGVATPSTNPGTPDQRVFYIAATPGAYSNFGLTVNNGEVAILRYDTTWAKLTTGIAPALVGYQFMGVATPTTNPGTPSAKVCYLAATSGTYTNFKDTNDNSLVLTDKLTVLKFDSAWSASVISIPSISDVDRLAAYILRFSSLATIPDADSEHNYYINTSGATITSASWTCWTFTRRADMKVIHARLHSNPTSGFAIAFYSSRISSAATFISGAPLVNGFNDYKISIPDNCQLILICSRTADGDDSEIYISSGEYAFDDAKRATAAYLSENPVYPSGDLVQSSALLHYYVTGAGVITGSSGWNAYFFPVKFLRKIRFRTYSSLGSPYNYYAITFYSGDVPSSNTLIGGMKFLDDYTSGDLVEADIPVGAVTAMVCCRNSDGTATIDGLYDAAQMSDAIVEIEAREASEEYDSVGNAAFWLNSLIGTYADFTWVGDRLVAFQSQAGEAQDPTTENAARLYIFDFPNGIEAAPTVRECYHEWGHCNTVDYNAGNDCLILGNGSGSYTLTGDIIVIPDFADFAENAVDQQGYRLTDVNALVIHCDSTLGTKFNLMWGDDNDENYNIAYLITANYGGSTEYNGKDLEIIRKIVLRKGEEVGAYGSVITNETPFNGTFDIVATYTQKTAGYPNCIQGGCYHNGRIFAAIGHDGLWIWEMRLGSDGKIYRKNRKQVTYYSNKPTNYGNATGVCYKDGFLFIGRAGIGSMAIRLDF